MAGLFGGVLPALFSTGDYLKRRVNSLVSDPVGDIQQTLGYTQDRLNELQRLQALADKGDPQAQEQVNNAYLNATMNFAPAGIIGTRFKTGTPTEVPFFGTAKEIPDNFSTVSKEKLQEATESIFRQGKPDVRVKDVLWHPSLYRDYPEVGNMPVSPLAFAQPGTKASFSEYKGGAISLPKITAETTPEQLKEIHSSLLHEIQHSVQMLDNMPKGANPEMFKKGHKQELAAKLSKAEHEARQRLDEYVRPKYDGLNWSSFLFNTNAAKEAASSDEKLKELADYYARVTNLRKKAEKRAPNAFEQYRKVAGEAQARAVQQRFENPSEYANPVEASYDVPFSDLLRSPLDTTIK